MLVTPCTTRFLERHDAVICLRDLQPAVARCLDAMLSWHSTQTRHKESQLLAYIRSPVSLVALSSLKVVSILPVSRSVQAKNMDETSSEHHLHAATKIFGEWRSEPEQKFKEIFKEAEQLAEELGESIRLPRCAFSAAHRARL